MAGPSPFKATKILKNSHKLEKSSKPGLQDCTTCATLITTMWEKESRDLCEDRSNLLDVQLQIYTRQLVVLSGILDS